MKIRDMALDAFWITIVLVPAFLLDRFLGAESGLMWIFFMIGYTGVSLVHTWLKRRKKHWQ